MKKYGSLLFLILFLTVLGELFAAIKPGVAFLVGGPSGAGKTTLVHMALQNPNIRHLLSPYVLYTTRPMRDGEINGVDYLFISTEEFEDMVQQGKIFYTIKYDRHQYGYSVKLIDDLANGESFIVIVGPSDATRTLQGTLPHAVLIWVDVSDPEMLKRRLEIRYKNNPDAVKRRYDNVVLEREAERLENLFHYHILNDDGRCEEAFGELCQIIHSSYF